MPRPKRIRLSRAKGWRLPANAVNVARPTRWGNPFLVGQHGDAAECVHLYARMLGGCYAVVDGLSVSDLRERARWIREHLAEIRGRDLACWCRLDKPCHADVLMEVANA